MSAFDLHPPIVKTLRWPDEAATQSFAARLATAPGLMQAVIALHGDLGSGKTTLTRHLLQTLGVAGRIKSPTYTIVEPYTVGALSIWHFDFYRFNDPQEWEDAGFRDIFASPGLKLIEWPEKAAAMLPVADLDLRLTIALGTQDPQNRSEAARLVTIDANTLLGAALAGACT